MKKNKRFNVRSLSFALSAAIAMTLAPVNAFAGMVFDVPGEEQNVSIVKSFGRLGDRFHPAAGGRASEHIYSLTVAVNSTLEALELPKELEVLTEGMIPGGTATPSDAFKTRMQVNEDDAMFPDHQLGGFGDEIIDIPVTWNSNKIFDSGKSGQYIFTAELPEGYILAEGVELPRIYVNVGRQGRMAAGSTVINLGEIESFGDGYSFWDGHLTLNGEEGSVYTLTGDGGGRVKSIAIQSNVTVILDGVTVRNRNSGHNVFYAMRLDQGGTIILKEGTVNTIIGERIGIYCVAGTLRIEGEGSLNLSGDSDGIYMPSSDTLLIENGDINISSEEYGISCDRGTIHMTGGNLTAIGNFGAFFSREFLLADGAEIKAGDAAPVNVITAETMFPPYRYLNVSFPEMITEKQEEITLGSTEGYDNTEDGLKKAIANIADQGTIRLGSQIDINSTIRISGGSFTIDLNGQNLRGADGRTGIYAEAGITPLSIDGGNIIIMDSSTGGLMSGGAGGTYLNQAWPGGNGLTVTGGNVTIKSGNYKGGDGGLSDSGGHGGHGLNIEAGAESVILRGGMFEGGRKGGGSAEEGFSIHREKGDGRNGNLIEEGYKAQDESGSDIDHELLNLDVYTDKISIVKAAGEVTNERTSNNGGSRSSSDSTKLWNCLPPSYQGETKYIGNVLVPDYTVAGSWFRNSDGTWMFKGKDGIPYAGGWVAAYNPYADLRAGQSAFGWFLFDNNGVMQTGWYTDASGDTYYLNISPDNTLGAMCTGWTLIDGNYYYFNEQADGSRGKLMRDAKR